MTKIYHNLTTRVFDQEDSLFQVDDLRKRNYELICKWLKYCWIKCDEFRNCRISGSRTFIRVHLTCSSSDMNHSCHLVHIQCSPQHASDMAIECNRGFRWVAFWSVFRQHPCIPASGFVSSNNISTSGTTLISTFSSITRATFGFRWMMLVVRMQREANPVKTDRCAIFI